MIMSELRAFLVSGIFLISSRFAYLFAACCEYPVYNIYLAIKRTSEPHGK
jgi:hypothetical protein